MTYLEEAGRGEEDVELEDNTYWSKADDSDHTDCVWDADTEVTARARLVDN